MAIGTSTSHIGVSGLESQLGSWCQLHAYVHSGKQQVMAQVLECWLLTWETWIEFLAPPDYSPRAACHCRHLGGEPATRRLYLLCFCLSNNFFKIFIYYLKGLDTHTERARESWRACMCCSLWMATTAGTEPGSSQDPFLGLLCRRQVPNSWIIFLCFKELDPKWNS